jgi:hypothetical protein
LLSVPPFSLFRYPVKYIVGAGFCVCIAGMRGLDRLRALARRRPARPETARRLVLLVIVLCTLGLALALFGHMRIGALAGVAWALVVLLLGVAAWTVPRGPRRWDKVHRALGALVVAELALASFPFGTKGWLDAAALAQQSPLRPFLPGPTEGRVSVDLPIEARDAHFRAEDFILNSRAMLVPMRNVEEGVAVVQGYGPPEPLLYTQAFDAGLRGLYDLGGVTHYLGLQGPPFPNLERVANAPGPLEMYRSRTALPRAYLSQNARSATDAEALAALGDAREPFREVTFLAEGEPLATTAPCKSAPPRWLRYQPSALSLEVETCAPAYLVVTDSFFPGWEAKVDGIATPIRRANLLVRAILVPAGKHRVEMVYRPASVRWGLWASTLGLVLTLGGWARGRAWRSRPQDLKVAA